jgi:hypothetical protein
MEKYFVYRAAPFKDVPYDEQLLTMLKNNRIYSYMPNVRAWLYSGYMDKEFFLSDPTTEFREVTKDEAHAIAVWVRPYNPLVGEILMKDAKDGDIIPLETFL